MKKQDRNAGAKDNWKESFYVFYREKGGVKTLGVYDDRLEAEDSMNEDPDLDYFVVFGKKKDTKKETLASKRFIKIQD